MGNDGMTNESPFGTAAQKGRKRKDRRKERKEKEKESGRRLKTKR